MYNEIAGIIERNERAVLLTIIKKEGSVPNAVGAKMLLWPDGKTAGTVGGGNPEAVALKKASNVFKTGKPEIIAIDLYPETSNVGSICGGRLEIFAEPVNFKQNIIIFGGGHVGYEVYKLSKKLEYNVTVIDDREDFANSYRFPLANKVICGDYLEKARDIVYDNDTYVIIVTKGHKGDNIVLKAILEKENQPAYIGMIGSRKKVKILFEDMISSGISQEKLNRVYAPIGLDIGGDSPAEIAVSILAEILKVKYEGTGKSLKELV